MFQKILVPVDLTEPELTDEAVRAALELAKVGNASLRLVNVQVFMAAAGADYVPPNFGDLLREAAEQQLAEEAAAIDYPPDRISSAVRFGAVYHEVLLEADDWGADLIVICSHRPSMATYLLGSNAQNIVRHAKTSVLVLRR
jgi:nucleotide-binding universal stress UspA family protein